MQVNWILLTSQLLIYDLVNFIIFQWILLIYAMHSLVVHIGFLEGEKMVALTLILEIQKTRILYFSIFATQCTQIVAFITQMHVYI